MIVKEFGERLKELRQNTGLSQEKFALKINMDLLQIFHAPFSCIWNQTVFII